MQIFVITPEHTIKDEIKIVHQLFAIGLQRLHLRKPQFSVQECKNYIAAIDHQFHSRIVIHNSFQLLKEFKLGGIHLNSQLRDDSTIKAQVTALSPASISTSFHAW